MIEKLYEQILLEQSLLKLILQNKEELKRYLSELGALGTILLSPGIMASYVVKFLETNFPNLPETIVNSIKNIPSEQLLSLLK